MLILLVTHTNSKQGQYMQPTNNNTFPRRNSFPPHTSNRSGPSMVNRGNPTTSNNIHANGVPSSITLNNIAHDLARAGVPLTPLQLRLAQQAVANPNDNTTTASAPAYLTTIPEDTGLSDDSESVFSSSSISHVDSLVIAHRRRAEREAGNTVASTNSSVSGNSL